jgi:uncharacterized Fe-S center protein
MASKVYFSDFRSRSAPENKISKIRKLLEAGGLDEFVDPDDLTAVKLHFGEEGNDSYINPVFVRPVVDRIKEKGGKPFLTDTNTLYFGSRHDSVQHLKTAIRHGFDYAVTGAPVIIADGLLGGNWEEVEIGLKHFQKVKIAGDILNADGMVVMSHFKGHGMSGFGGALKNLAMGCSAVPGKIEQHECAKPLVTELCSGCGTCVEACPLRAVFMGGGKSQIKYAECIGCNNCVDTCPESAIDLDWDKMEIFMEKMIEYAYGAVKNKKDGVFYLNFLMNITPDCDCDPWSDLPLVPDIGILASKDPVAVDNASYGLVNQQQGFERSMLVQNHEKGCDKFKGVWDRVDGRVQLRYGQEIGLGSQKYELINIDE